MVRERMETALVELERELATAQQQEQAAMTARLRLEGAVAVLRQLLKETQLEETTDDGNN